MNGFIAIEKGCTIMADRYTEQRPNPSDQTGNRSTFANLSNETKQKRLTDVDKETKNALLADFNAVKSERKSTQNRLEINPLYQWLKTHNTDYLNLYNQKTMTQEQRSDCEYLNRAKGDVAQLERLKKELSYVDAVIKRSLGYRTWGNWWQEQTGPPPDCTRSLLKTVQDAIDAVTSIKDQHTTQYEKVKKHLDNPTLEQIRAAEESFTSWGGVVG
jgi:hypothetical protein